jgi:hypothetical protein
MVAIAAEGSNLAAPPAQIHRAGVPAGTMHKPLLDIAGKYPILAHVNHHIFGCHFPTSTRMSVLGVQNRQAGHDLWFDEIISEGCRERRNGSDYSMKTQTRVWQVSTLQKEDDCGQSQRGVWSPFRRIRARHCGVGGFACSFDGRR